MWWERFSDKLGVVKVAFIRKALQEDIKNNRLRYHYHQLIFLLQSIGNGQHNLVKEIVFPVNTTVSIVLSK